ncbi:MAG: iron ABC transporter permease [archaeon]|nr:iron ABC transporter permease [archaeon]
MESEKQRMKEEYSKYTGRKLVFIAVCAVLVFFMFFVSLCVGTRDLSVSDVFTLFIDHIKGVTYDESDPVWFNDRIIWNYRVPRAVFAIVAGIALAVAGSVMQSSMKNPLADPYTTGVSSGALFGVAVAMTMGFSVASGSLAVTINAIVFALVPIALIVLMAPMFRKSPSTLILSGVAVSYLFSSMTSLLLVTTDSATLSMVYTWQVGTLSDLTWDVLPLSVASTLAGVVIIMPLANRLNLMSLDDKDAKSLGLDIEKFRVLCLVVLSVMTAVVISYVGIIGFVGLIIPHIVRLILGSDNKYLIPAAASFGALFLLGCDIVSRSVDLSATIPVGVITSFIGAPIFLYLIIRQKNAVW